MTKAIAVAVLSLCLSFVAGIAVADKVRDWHDLEAAHNHVQEAIHEMDRARAANHYDMAGLIVAGSIVGFTAYVWLLHHESPTKVGTYAYVNPVVAVIVGYFLGGETVGPRTLLGTLLVLVSVVVITTARAPKPAAPPLVNPLQELADR